MPQNSDLPGYSAIYAFGDSLSDAGNLSIVTALTGITPVSPPYYEEHYGLLSGNVFSNGPTWVQDLSIAFGLGTLAPSLLGGTDFAYGGAETGLTPQNANSSDLELQAISLPAQLVEFQTEVPDPSSNALYTLSIGSNDLLEILGQSGLTAQQQTTDVNDAVANEIGFVKQLVADGAKNFLVLDVPDLGKTPDVTEGLVNGSDTPSAALDAEASQLAAAYNAALTSQLAGIAAADQVAVTVINAYQLIDDAVADPAAYGLTNVTSGVWSGDFTSSDSGTLATTSVAAQDQYLFWDDLHPTETGQQALAALAEDELGGGTVTASLPAPNDFTGNGTSDILFSDPSTGGVGDFLMNDNVPTWAGVGSTTAGWNAVGVGDFTGNGTDDILFQNSSTGGVGDFLMDDNVPTWAGVGSTAAGWNAVGVGDFTGNGTDDILFQNSSTGGVGDFLMDDNVPTWAGVGQAATGWNVVGVGDFTGNGTDDILFQDPTTGALGMFEMDNNVPTWVGIGATATNWQVVGVGDFTGNGTDDILFRDASSGALGDFLMNNGVPTWAGVGQAATNWEVVGIGDYTGNGTDDILFRDASSGALGEFVMNDNHPTWQEVGWAATSWQVVG